MNLLHNKGNSLKSFFHKLGFFPPDVGTPGRSCNVLLSAANICGSLLRWCSDTINSVFLVFLRGSEAISSRSPFLQCFRRCNVTPVLPLHSRNSYLRYLNPPRGRCQPTFWCFHDRWGRFLESDRWFHFPKKKQKTNAEELLKNMKRLLRNTFTCRRLRALVGI